MQSMKRLPSVKRNALYIGVSALSVSLVTLCYGVATGHPAGVEVAAVAGALGGAISYSYVRGKIAEATITESATDGA